MTILIILLASFGISLLGYGLFGVLAMISEKDYGKDFFILLGYFILGVILLTIFVYLAT